MKFYLLFAAFIGTVIFVHVQENPKREDSVLGAGNSVPEIIPIPTLDHGSFYQAVNETQNSTTECCIKGGIVPHHTIAGHLIADFFGRVASEKIHTVILLSPNHFAAGSSDIISSYSIFETSRGKIRTNQAILEPLVSQGLVTLDTKIIQNEHGITAILPYIAHYLPSASVVPLVIKNGLDVTQIERVAVALTQYAQDSGVLVVGAFDFSHYQYPHETEMYDKQTIQYINNFDYETVTKLGNEYTDSPSPLAILIKTMQNVRTKNPLIQNHSNSSQILGLYSNETTSHLEVLYTY